MRTHTINLSPAAPDLVEPEDSVIIVDGPFRLSVKGGEFLAIVRLVQLLRGTTTFDASVKSEAIKLHRALTADDRYGLRTAKALVDAAFLYQGE